MNIGLSRRMPFTVSVTRATIDPVTGKRTTAATANVPCSQLFPISPELALRVPDRAPFELLQCFIPGSYGVVEGNVITFDGREYPVRDAGEWKLRNLFVSHLIVEDVKSQ